MRDQSGSVESFFAIIITLVLLIVGLFVGVYLYPSWQCGWTCDREQAESEYRFLAQPACMCRKGDKFFRPGWAIDGASREPENQ